MKLVFWSCASLIAFTYAGYPMYLYWRAKLWPRAIRRASIFPSVTIVMAVRNEETHLPAKLLNLAALNYPGDRLDIIVVSDGSTDRTNGLLAEWQNSAGRRAVLLDHGGKACALNHGIAQAHGEIVCFTDARQEISCDGLKNLMKNFADASIGCASGELVLRGDGKTAASDGVGLYWRLEKKIRNWEGIAGSTVGTTGAFYSARRDLLPQLPEGTILDDLYIPLQVARHGWRVVFDPSAVAWDGFASSPRQEFRRKVRTLSGNYQLLRLAPWLLTGANPVRFHFVCHKLLRLIVPLALLALLLSAFWIHQGIYAAALLLQILVYALAILSACRVKAGFLSRLSNVSLAFLLMNTAAAVAFVYFITGRKAAWVR